MLALRWKSVLAVAAMSAAQWLVPAIAQGADAYPSRPIHLIVPFTPGGGTDTLARVLAQQMGESLHATVITENRPGAGTVVGSDYVARSNPDGYTVLLTTSAHAINQTLVPKLPYAVEKNFASIALVGQAPNVLVVRPDSRFKTVQDIVAYAKAHPGKLTYGSSGTGTAVHLAAELFKSTAHIDLTHVPYKGANPAMTDLLGGQIDMFFGTSGAVSPLVKAGKLRAIAVTSAKPSPAWPGIPTIAESGYPGYVADVWYGLFAAAGTPAPIIEKLNQAVNAAVRSDLYKQRMASEGLDSPPSTPAQLDAYVHQEVLRWRKVIQDGHITAG
ncbi:Bug family tripartite tricarboxylate transporter substrate binding protein [Bordetella bronchialis]|uniref:LacI family transcriptional regulator n=1 Tax=Bordetella bronchialis TaxID=463025 RepID=A0A193FG46_9BORD|nr:tripartite tricarboxylate transporter substrate binding protein [Bordetella bronchialis]ANN66605.1 LacI family transcriptional regulator [Bordetella bronchialis]ANN71684.1 LacI family transcriptional regulator [Bordetella bronchialis]